MKNYFDDEQTNVVVCLEVNENNSVLDVMNFLFEI